MSAFEPPHTPGLAGSALDHRALAPVKHNGHDKPAETEYKGGVHEVAPVQGVRRETPGAGIQESGGVDSANVWRGAALRHASRPRRHHALFAYCGRET